MASNVIRTREVRGPSGQVAIIATVRDSRFLPVRHTVGRVMPRSCLPVAVFVDHPRPGDVALGSAAVYRGNWAAAVQFAEAMVSDPTPEAT
jgi:hypothetical protein